MRPANAFYEAKLSAAGVDTSIGSLEEFAARCPMTTKDELAADQAAQPPYGTNLSFPLAQYNRIHQTSDTTGKPLRWLDTPEKLAKHAYWQTVYRAAGITREDRVLCIFLRAIHRVLDGLRGRYINGLPLFPRRPHQHHPSAHSSGK